MKKYIVAALVVSTGLWLNASSSSATLIDCNQRLISAAKYGNLKRVQQALRAGADINCLETDGTSDGARPPTTPLIAAITGWKYYSPSFFSNYEPSFDVINYLLRAGANVNGTREPDGATPLMLFAAAGETLYIAKLLELGANINAESKSGGTAFDVALEHHNHATTRFLFTKGAGPKTMDQVRSVLSYIEAHRLWLSGWDDIKEMILKRARAEEAAKSARDRDGVWQKAKKATKRRR